MATSLFQALGSLGSQYGNAANQVQEENLQRSLLARNMQRQDAQDALARRRVNTEEERLNLEKTNATAAQKAKENEGWAKAIKFVGAGGKTYYMNSFTGDVSDTLPGIPAGAVDPTSEQGREFALEGVLKRPLTQQDREILAGVRNKPSEKAPTEYEDWVAAVTREEGHPPTKSEIELFHRRPTQEGTYPASPYIAALANKWQKEGIKPPAKFQPAVEQYMEDNNMTSKLKLSNQDQRSVELLKQLEPKVGAAMKLLEDNKLQDQNDWLFGKYSVLGQHMRFKAYQYGKAPSDPVSSQLIKAAAALQVMGAAPWVQLGRGKYLFETISQHLPSPTDTPKNLYQKLQFLQGVVDDAKGSLPEGAFGGDTDSIDKALDKIFKKP